MNKRPLQFPLVKLLATVSVFLYLVSFNLSVFAKDSKSIPIVSNLFDDRKLQQRTKKVILLYVSAPNCAFCKKLEKEILLPLIHSGEYEQKIILRKIDWHSKELIIDFSNKAISPTNFLDKYHIQITPTLLFLGANGVQINKRLLGYRGGEFYWHYFDVAIEQANKRLAG